MITTPMASFFAGEEIEIALTNVLSCPQPQVARFHVQADRATGSFDADSSYTDFAPAPSAVAIGDLDGVNGLDAAVVSGSNIVILLNNSNGKFTVQSQTYAVNSPSAIAIGDLDGINGLDLAVASGGSDNVFVLLNTGNGTFQTAVPHDAGGWTADIAIGDLNGDGSLDLATAGNGPNFIVLMNNGAGTFPTHQMGTLAGGTIGRAVAIGDLNGNGSPDIAVGSRNPNEVTVILNDGHGKFTPQSPTYPVGDFVGAWPTSMAIGDLGGNGGGLDIAVATTSNNGVSVLLNNDDGTGTFQSPAPYLARQAVSLAIGDVNGDGRLDIAVAIQDPDNGNGGEVLLNNGSGTFSPNPSFFVGTNANAIAMGDLNGNGILDLAFTTNGDPISQSDLSVWLGQAPVP